MAIFGEDDRKWALAFCVGCRQTTWHYDGLCSNRAFHRSSSDYTLSISDAALAAGQPQSVGVVEGARRDEAATEEH